MLSCLNKGDQQVIDSLVLCCLSYCSHFDRLSIYDSSEELAILDALVSLSMKVVSLSSNLKREHRRLLVSLDERLLVGLLLDILDVNNCSFATAEGELSCLAAFEQGDFGDSMPVEAKDTVTIATCKEKLQSTVDWSHIESQAPKVNDSHQESSLDCRLLNFPWGIFGFLGGGSVEDYSATGDCVLWSIPSLLVDCLIFGRISESSDCTWREH